MAVLMASLRLGLGTGAAPMPLGEAPSSPVAGCLLAAGCRASSDLAVPDEEASPEMCRPLESDKLEKMADIWGDDMVGS